MSEKPKDDLPEAGEINCFSDVPSWGYKFEAEYQGDGSYRIITTDHVGTKQTADTMVSIHSNFPIKVLLPDADGSPYYEYAQIDWKPNIGFSVIPDGWLEEQKGN